MNAYIHVHHRMHAERVLSDFFEPQEHDLQLQHAGLQLVCSQGWLRSERGSEEPHDANKPVARRVSSAISSRSQQMHSNGRKNMFGAKCLWRNSCHTRQAG